jgi:hypothetical protein
MSHASRIANATGVDRPRYRTCVRPPDTEPTRRTAAENALKSLQESAELSRNTADILNRTLAG